MGETVSPLARMIRELRRRRVFRTAALYVVGAWLVMQVADVVFPALEIPERALRYVLFAALAGFPVALVFGWRYDIGPHGIRRTPAAGPAELAEPDPLRRADYGILTALAAVVVAILYNTLGGVMDTPMEAPVRGESGGPPVIAVLPFTTTARGDDSELFAAGIHDDLLTQLSKLESVRVISRTSVMQYAGTTKNVRDIGAELGADAILEGGVQVVGEQIRINAQLIDARTDEHLWAQTYDRSLSAGNIFEVQGQITRAITSAMNAALSAQDESRLSLVPTENLAAYRAYRNALALRTTQDTGEFDVIDELKKAVELDPRFARAWAELAGAYAYGSRRPGREHMVQLAEEAMARVRELAPGSAEDFIAQSHYLYYAVDDYDLARDTLQKAIAMNPSDTSLLELRGWIERRQGAMEAREATLRLLLNLDPRSDRHRYSLFFHLVLMHDFEAARDLIDAAENPAPYFQAMREALEVEKTRDFELFRERIERLEPRLDSDAIWFAWLARVLNRDFEAAAASLERFRVRKNQAPGTMSGGETVTIQTAWMTGEPGRFAETLAAVRERIEAARSDDGSFPLSWSYRNLALLEAAAGNREEALTLMRGWDRLSKEDEAERVNQSLSCEIYGMVGAAGAAVDCLRNAFSEPSDVLWFIDPYLPSYDTVREAPEFRALLAEIEAQDGPEAR